MGKNVNEFTLFRTIADPCRRRSDAHRAWRMRSTAGFSLVELLSSLVVFSVVSLGVATSSVTTVRTTRASQQKAVAVNLAHQVLECVKSQIQAGRTINPSNAGQDCTSSAPPAGYTFSDVAVTSNPAGFPGLTRVQMTISWRSPLPGSLPFDWLVDA
jgi:prepilin-type N-terminal cleavage/methylation domain-containing protein